MAATTYIEGVQISVANPSQNGTGAMTLVSQGTGAGKQVTGLIIQALGNTLKGVIRVFYSSDSGVTKRLIGEIVVNPAVQLPDPPDTLLGFFGSWSPPIQPFVLLNATQQLYVSTHNAQLFNIFSVGLLL